MKTVKAFLTKLRETNSFDFSSDFKSLKSFINTLNRQKRKDLGIEVITMSSKAVRKQGIAHFVCLAEKRLELEAYLGKHFQTISDASYSP
jgi:hypothetical protein